MENDETWLPVVGFEGRYEVSDLGRVRSLWIAGRAYSRPRKEPKILALKITGTGYYFVTLCRDSFHKMGLVHVLVLEAFNSTRPSGMDCCHNDSDRMNNRLINLRWDTRSGNLSDRLIHGTDQRGERANGARLTESIVIDMRSRPKLRGAITAMAREFGVAEETVSSVLKRKTWRHI